MRLPVRRMVAVLVLVHATGGCGPAVSEDDERAKLRGTWEVVDAERRGAKNPGYIGLRYEFEDDRLRVTTSEAEKGTWAQYTLDVAAFPRRIQSPGPGVPAKTTAVARTQGSIYRIEGAKLQICRPMDGSDFPKNFSSKPDNVLLTLRRIPFSDADEERARQATATKRSRDAAWQSLQPFVGAKYPNGKYNADFGSSRTSWHSNIRPSGFPYPGKIPEERWQDVLTLRDIGLLGLRACKGVGDDQMRYVGKLLSLEALDLHSTDVDDAGLAQLTGITNLQQLDLSFTPVTDKGLAVVASMRGLKKLILQGTSTTEEGIAKLRAARKELEIDWPRPYTDSQRKAAAALSRLRVYIDDKLDRETGVATCEIMFSSVGIREHVVATKPGGQPTMPGTSSPMLDAALVGGYLEKLPAPTSVSATSPWPNWTDDSMIACLKGIHGLVKLNLTASQITDAGVVELGRHKSLKRLDLGACKRITDQGVAHLASLTDLERLNLRAIKLTPASLAPLVNLRHLKALSLDREALNDDLNRRFRQNGVELRFYGL